MNKNPNSIRRTSMADDGEDQQSVYERLVKAEQDMEAEKQKEAKSQQRAAKRKKDKERKEAERLAEKRRSLPGRPAAAGVSETKADNDHRGVVVSGRPSDGPTSAVRSVYIRDQMLSSRVDEIVSRSSRPSFSAVVQQLLSGMVDSADAQEEGEDPLVIEVNVKVRL